MAYIHKDCIEFEDVDVYGIAHHSKLINLMERARVHFFEDAGIDVVKGDFYLVMVSMQVDFKAPAKMMSRVDVKVSVEKLQNAVVHWRYLISEKGNLLVDSRVKQACLSKESFRPMRFPEHVMEKLEGLVSG